MASFFSLITELETLLEQLNTILAGADDETVEVNGLTKDSISKAIKDKYTELLTGQRDGVIVFKSYTELNAYTPASGQELMSFKVSNDSNSEMNGYYHWVGGTTYEKDADLVANIINKSNTSDAVSGYAVHVNQLLDHSTYTCFTRYGDNDLSGLSDIYDSYTSTIKAQIYKAFKSIEVYGLEKTESLKLKIIWASYTKADVEPLFRLVFSKHNGSSWDDVFNSGSILFSDLPFTSEDVITYEIDNEDGTKLIAEIDLSLIPTVPHGYNFNADEPEMIVSAHCFKRLKNVIEPNNTTEPVSSKAVHDEVLTSLKSVLLTGGVLKAGKALSFGSIDGKYITNNGSEASFTSFSCTTYIPVVAGKRYLINTDIQDNAGIAFYNKLGEFISYIDDAMLAGSDNILTVPIGCDFLRASYKTANGMNLLANEDITYGNTLLNLFKQDAESEKSLFSKELIFGGVVKSGNKLTVSSTPGAYINNLGEVSPYASSTSYTMFVPVIPGKSYLVSASISDDMRLAYYDKNYEFLSALTGEQINETSKVIMIPSNCYYLRSSFATSAGFNLYAQEDITYDSLLINLQRQANRDIELISFEPEEGKLLNSSGGTSTNPGFNYTSINVNAGDVIYIEGYTTGNARLHNANGKLFPEEDTSGQQLKSDWVLIESDGVLEISYIKKNGLVLYKKRSFNALKKELNRMEGLTHEAQSQLDDIFIPIDVTEYAQDGYFLRSNGDKGSSAYFTYISLPVKAGDAFHISGYVQDQARLHDANGTVFPSSEVEGGLRSDDTVYIQSDGVLHISYKKSTPFVIKKIAILDGIAETIDKKIESHNFNADISFLRAFHRNVLCLGDSLTNGANYDVGGAIEECYPYYLNLISGWVTTNAGYSGYAPIQIWDEHIDSYDGGNYDACILWLGTNNGLTDTIYDDTQSGDYLTYAETETGRYCSIIEKLLSDNPNIKLYFFTVFATEGSLSTTNNVIAQLAEKYNGYLIDCNPNSVIFPAPEIHKYNTVHFDKIGNAILANTFYDGILNAINNNIQDYDVVLLGSRSSSVFDNY